MKEKTILKFIEQLKDIKAEGASVAAYADKHSLCKQTIYNRFRDFQQTCKDSPYYEEVTDLYNSIIYGKCEENKVAYTEPVDTGNYTEVDYDRDDEGHIIYYNYKIYRKNKNPLVGKLSRDEMNIVYRLYSYYGASLTQREVSRYFPDLSLVDFKRILSAFNIYKASAPFAPHIIEEKTTDELREMQIREKENDFLKKIEEDKIKSNERLLKKYAAENEELKDQLSSLKNFQFKLIDCPKIIRTTSIGKPNYEYINLYLADMHIGATVTSGTLYSENINYGVDEVARRLNEILNKVSELGTFKKINVCLMGDMIDCCGPTNKTARLDHNLPENMDGFEQADAYISLVKNFIEGLASAGICNDIRIYSVRCGNHTGPIEYVATKALFAELKLQGIKSFLSNGFFCVFKEGEHSYCLTHGKESIYMKKGMPLNLDDKNKVMLYDWLEDNGITGDNIHIIKGDLHSSNYSSCKKLDYRNVLSLFGSSDYSAFNYTRNSYGISYDMCINGNIVRGEFQNI